MHRLLVLEEVREPAQYVCFFFHICSCIFSICLKYQTNRLSPVLSPSHGGGGGGLEIGLCRLRQVRQS